jgi:phenylacetate-CoA ligase
MGKRIAVSDIKVRLGPFGGEPSAGVSGDQKKIEEGLGIKAHDYYYGLAEIGPTFSAECDRQTGLHWAEDHVSIEVIDPETKDPCETGKLGVLVFTHPTKEVPPVMKNFIATIRICLENI